MATHRPEVSAALAAASIRGAGHWSKDSARLIRESDGARECTACGAAEGDVHSHTCTRYPRQRVRHLHTMPVKSDHEREAS
jgi:hypothetical protein